MLHVLGPPVPAVDPRDSERVPVLLVPGFMAGDWSLIPLARFLRQCGHPTYTSGIVLNSGCTAALLDFLERRLERVVEDAGGPVAVVGQSRGGTLSRMLAVRRPGLVAGLVTLGAPLLNPLATTRLVLRQVDAMIRLNRPGWSWLVSADCVAGACAERTVALLAAPFPAGLPFVSVYSRADGVVDWRSCLDPGAEHVEVDSSHNGMGTNGAVLRTVGSRLAGLSRPA
jgi:pimeloyl-ACP methyl ester carboxylesterase